MMWYHTHMLRPPKSLEAMQWTAAEIIWSELKYFLPLIHRRPIGAARQQWVVNEQCFTRVREDLFPALPIRLNM